MVRLTITTWVIILAGVSANKLSTHEKTKTGSADGVSTEKKTTNKVSAIGVSALKTSAYGVSKENMSTNKVSAVEVSARNVSANKRSKENVSAETSADMLGDKRSTVEMPTDRESAENVTKNKMTTNKVSAREKSASNESKKIKHWGQTSANDTNMDQSSKSLGKRIRSGTNISFLKKKSQIKNTVTKNRMKKAKISRDVGENGRELNGKPKINASQGKRGKNDSDENTSEARKIRIGRATKIKTNQKEESRKDPAKNKMRKKIRTKVRSMMRNQMDNDAPSMWKVRSRGSEKDPGKYLPRRVLNAINRGKAKCNRNNDGWLWNQLHYINQEDMVLYGDLIIRKVMEIPVNIVEYKRDIASELKVKRQKRNNSKTKTDVVRVYDCNKGGSTQSNMIRECFMNESCIWDDMNKMSTISIAQILFNQMKEAGIATDHFMMEQRGIGLKYVQVSREARIVYCKAFNGIKVHGGKCYADGAYTVLVNNSTYYATRTNFISPVANEIPCESLTDHEEAVKQINFYLSILVSSSLLATTFFLNYNSGVLSRLVDKISIEHIIYMEAAYLSGLSAKSLLVKAIVVFKSVWPVLVMVYGAISAVNGTILFFLSMAKRLPCLKAWSFLLPFLKKINDFRSYLANDKIARDNEITAKYRKSIGRNEKESFGALTSQHLSSLYHHGIEMSKRITELEMEIELIKRGSNPEGSSSVTTVSSFNIEERMSSL